MTNDANTDAAIKVVVEEGLAGQDRPIMSDDTLLISPAMWLLMNGASEDEVQQLLENLLPMNVPGFHKEGA